MGSGQTGSGKTAWITGAGSGIGRALALGLARRGAKLAVSDVNAEGLAGTVSLLGGTEVHDAPLDVADRDAVHAYADAVAEHFGVVNQIYNNAGIAFSRTVAESEYADYERVFSINLWGVIHGTKAFLPHLIASGEGHVVNVSSLNGVMAQAQMSHYCATKFAVRGFTESLGLELADAGHPVRTTSVHPGGIKTNIANAAFEDSKKLGLPVTADDEKRRQVYNEKLLKMSPDKAAEIILGAVEKNRPRVMVGNDARALDLLVRALPASWSKIVGPATKRLVGN